MITVVPSRAVRFLGLAMASLLLMAGCSSGSTEETSDTSTTTIEVESTTTPDTESTETTTSSSESSEEEENTQSAEDAAVMEEALETLNLSTCNEIQNSLSRESCVNNVVMAQVRATGVTDLCVNITDKDSQADCMALSEGN